MKPELTYTQAIYLPEGPKLKECVTTAIKKSLRLRARRPIRPALMSGFISMRRLGVFLLPPGWDTGPSYGYPSIRRYPFIHLGGKRHRESKVSCPITQHNVPSQDPLLHSPNSCTGQNREKHHIIRFDNGARIAYSTFHLLYHDQRCSCNFKCISHHQK